jgi:hypothetical protein
MATTQILTQDSTATGTDACKCGAPDCLGHEVEDEMVLFPGFTSRAAMDKSKKEIVVWDRPVTLDDFHESSWLPYSAQS